MRKTVFVHFVYELYYSSSKLRHFTWIFEYALDSTKKNGNVLIAQQKYFDWLRSKKESPAAIHNDFLYETSNSSDLELIQYYEIPECIDNQILSEQGNATKAWAYMMTSSYAPMLSLLTEIINKILASDKIEGIILIAPCHSLEEIAKNYEIPLIHWDIAPIRYPIYKSIAYLDFQGTQGAKNEASKRFDAFKQEVDANAFFKTHLFSPKELLALFLSDDYLHRIDSFDQDPIYEWGIALSPDVAYIHAFNNAYLQSEFIIDVNHGIDTTKAIIRSHPQDRFLVNSSTWSGAIDQSSDAEGFIVQCRRIACSGSKTAFLSMLWGRFTHVIKSPDSAFIQGASESFSLQDSRKANDEFISFITFAYFVPMEYFNDQDYLRWRLTNPSEIEIYTKNLTYYFSQIGVTLDEYFKVTKEDRVDYILKFRKLAIDSFPKLCNYFALLSDRDAVAFCTQKLRSNEIYSAAQISAYICARIHQPVSDLGFSGNLDIPSPEYDLTERYIWIEGWAYHGSGIYKITATLDNENLQPVAYGLPRQDVSDTFPEFGTINVGFGAWLDLGALNHSPPYIHLSFFANNGEKHDIEQKMFFPPLEQVNEIEYNQKNNVMACQIVELEENVAKLKEEINLILNSRSWRITRPLRHIKLKLISIAQKLKNSRIKRER